MGKTGREIHWVIQKKNTPLSAKAWSQGVECPLGYFIFFKILNEPYLLTYEHSSKEKKPRIKMNNQDCFKVFQLKIHRRSYLQSFHSRIKPPEPTSKKGITDI